jgi:multicomponent Na+:H+ antiporter subunit B
VQLFSGGELVEVGTGLIIAVFALLAMSHDWARDKSADEDDKSTSTANTNTAGGEHQ